MAGSSPAPESGSQTLERGLAVLVTVASTPGLTTAEVATASGLHRSITHRLLVSLQRTGFAVRDGGGRWAVGPTAAGLVDQARPRLRDVAAPVLDRLAVEVGATASLVEVVGDAAVTTYVAEPPTDGPRYSYRLGNRDPLDRGAGGVAALASAPGRPSEPPRVTEARAVGHVVTHAELNPGAHAVAVPLPGWPVPAAVNVVAADPDVVSAALDPVRRSAAAISAALVASQR